MKPKDTKRAIDQLIRTSNITIGTAYMAEYEREYEADRGREIMEEAENDNG